MGVGPLGHGARRRCQYELRVDRPLQGLVRTDVGLRRDERHRRQQRPFLGRRDRTLAPGPIPVVTPEGALSPRRAPVDRSNGPALHHPMRPVVLVVRPPGGFDGVGHGVRIVDPGQLPARASGAVVRTEQGGIPARLDVVREVSPARHLRRVCAPLDVDVHAALGVRLSSVQSQHAHQHCAEAPAQPALVFPWCFLSVVRHDFCPLGPWWLFIVVRAFFRLGTLPPRCVPASRCVRPFRSRGVLPSRWRSRPSCLSVSPLHRGVSEHPLPASRRSAFQVERRALAPLLFVHVGTCARPRRAAARRPDLFGGGSPFGLVQNPVPERSCLGFTSRSRCRDQQVTRRRRHAGVEQGDQGSLLELAGDHQ